MTYQFIVVHGAMPAVVPLAMGLCPCPFSNMPRSMKNIDPDLSFFFFPWIAAWLYVSIVRAVALLSALTK